MADSKITALTAISTVDPAADPLVIVDVSDTSMAASGTTKKATINQLLGASGTATLASATISGDLTVDTSTLKVDSANNRVGIRTASPSEPLTVDNTSGVTTGAIRISAGDQAHSRLSIQNLNGQAYHLVAGNPGTSNAGFALYDNTAAATRWYVDNTGVQTWSNVGGVAGTAMTLNSTGLGVGVTPAVAFDVQGTSPMARLTSTSTTGYSSISLRNTGASGRAYGITVGGSGTGATAAGNLYITDDTASATRLVLDSSGNVGIGVTPSAWVSYKSLELPNEGYISSGNNWMAVMQNAYLSGSYKYKGNGNASYYLQQIGEHRFYTAPSGTAGNAITFTERLRLKETGQLRFVPLASDPSGAEAGDVYYNSTSNKLKCYNGTTWNDLF